MEAILKNIKKKRIKAIPQIVISNKADAKGIEIAKKMGIRTSIVDSDGLKGNNWDYDKKLVSVLEEHDVNSKNGLICLAGFMRIMSPEFIRHFKGRVMNIHPAILPSFPGLHSQRQALEYGVKYAGCTVHFVDEGVDTGPIILQAIVKTRNDDTEETLSKRILSREHKIYSEAIRLFCDEKIKIVGRRTIIS